MSALHCFDRTGDKLRMSRGQMLKCYCKEHFCEASSDPASKEKTIPDNQNGIFYI